MKAIPIKFIPMIIEKKNEEKEMMKRRQHKQAASEP